MSEETARPLRSFAGGRHTRQPDLPAVRRACLTTLIALVVQFGLGMWLNLYVQIPSADQHAGWEQEIKNGPAILTVHALVGTFLIGAAIVLLIRAIKVRNKTVAVLAAIGLGAILCAFAAGEFFVRDGGESRASMSMAALTGVALLSYIALQTLTSAAHTRQVRPGRGNQPEPVARVPYRGTPRPRLADATAPSAAGWPTPGHAAAGRPQPGYGPVMPTPAPAYWNSAAVPQAAYPPNRSGPQLAYLQTGRHRAQPRPYVQQAARGNTWQSWQPRPAGFGYPEES